MIPLSQFLMVPVRSQKTKGRVDKSVRPRCPQCNERWRVVRYGSYTRYRYESDERIAVQRYACRNPECPRRTFSVPPHGYLPFMRLSLYLLMSLYRQHVIEGRSINRLARLAGHSWTTIKRAVTLAKRLLDWCRNEIDAEAMDPWPCRPSRWSAFCRLYSYAFMPGRFVPQPVNTNR